MSGNWTKLGENVGVGYDVDGLMQAFINSPSHYRNLVDPDWNYVGVGVSYGSDGRMYTTHNFMAAQWRQRHRRRRLPPPRLRRPRRRPPSRPRRPPPRLRRRPPPRPPLPPPEPEPTEERVTAVLDPLRSLEQG